MPVFPLSPPAPRARRLSVRFVPGRRALLGAIAASVLASACVVAPVPPRRVVYAPVAPPPPRVEVIPVAPSPVNVWIPGHWVWDGRGHVWAPGHWETRRAGYEYVPGHWVAEGPRWRYAGGEWVRR